MKFKYLNIWSNGSSLHTWFVNLLRDKYQSSSVFSLYSEQTLERLESIKLEQPFFDDDLLLVIETENINRDIFNKLMKSVKQLTQFTVIIINSNMDLFQETSSILGDTVAELNCYKPPEWLVKLYAKNTFTKSFTLSGWEAFLIRMQRQWKLIDEYAKEIERSNDEEITKSTINKIIPVHESINFNQLVCDLLLGHNMKNHVKTLSNFKYANRFTFNETFTRLEKIIDLKKDYIKGVLGYSTIDEYCIENKLRLNEVRYYMDSVIRLCSLEFLYKMKHIFLRHKNQRDSILTIILRMESFYEGR